MKFIIFIIDKVNKNKIGREIVYQMLNETKSQIWDSKRKVNKNKSSNWTNGKRNFVVINSLKFDRYSKFYFN